MSFKAFGVGVVIILSGASGILAAAGCSDDYEIREVPQADGGPPREGGGGGDGSTAPTCPSTEAADTTRFGWKPPTDPQQDKCQADDLTAMREFLVAEPNATNENFRNFVKNRDTTCHDCVFAEASNLTWSPAPTQDGKVVTFNVGACYALVTGKQLCGRAIQNTWDCEFQACALCTTASELPGCRAKARTGVCKPFVDTSVTECASTPNPDMLCGSPFDSIRVQCVTSAADAGKL